MAADNHHSCISNPNFAVVCCFMDKYGNYLGLPQMSYLELQSLMEENKPTESCLVDLHVRLLRRIGKNVDKERWEKAIAKFCISYSEADYWEISEIGYYGARMDVKIRILKNLLEAQFDDNVKFKAKINELTPDDLRFMPIGKDRHGNQYFYMEDHDCNVRIFREDPDLDYSWELVAKNRDEVQRLIVMLHTNCGTDSPADKETPTETPAETPALTPAPSDGPLDDASLYSIDSVKDVKETEDNAEDIEPKQVEEKLEDDVNKVEEVKSVKIIGSLQDKEVTTDILDNVNKKRSGEDLKKIFDPLDVGEEEGKNLIKKVTRDGKKDSTKLTTTAIRDKRVEPVADVKENHDDYGDLNQDETSEIKKEHIKDNGKTFINHAEKEKSMGNLGASVQKQSKEMTEKEIHNENKLTNVIKDAEKSKTENEDKEKKQLEFERARIEYVDKNKEDDWDLAQDSLKSANTNEEKKNLDDGKVKEQPVNKNVTVKEKEEKTCKMPKVEESNENMKEEKETIEKTKIVEREIAQEEKNVIEELQDRIAFGKEVAIAKTKEKQTEKIADRRNWSLESQQDIGSMNFSEKKIQENEENEKTKEKNKNPEEKIGTDGYKAREKSMEDNSKYTESLEIKDIAVIPEHEKNKGNCYVNQKEDTILSKPVSQTSGYLYEQNNKLNTDNFIANQETKSKTKTDQSNYPTNYDKVDSTSTELVKNCENKILETVTTRVIKSSDINVANPTDEIQNTETDESKQVTEKVEPKDKEILKDVSNNEMLVSSDRKELTEISENKNVLVVEQSSTSADDIMKIDKMKLSPAAADQKPFQEVIWTSDTVDSINLKTAFSKKRKQGNSDSVNEESCLEKETEQLGKSRKLDMLKSAKTVHEKKINERKTEYLESIESEIIIKEYTEEKDMDNVINKTMDDMLNSVVQIESSESEKIIEIKVSVDKEILNDAGKKNQDQSKGINKKMDMIIEHQQNNGKDGTSKGSLKRKAGDSPTSEESFEGEKKENGQRPIHTPAKRARGGFARRTKKISKANERICESDSSNSSEEENNLERGRPQKKIKGKNITDDESKSSLKNRNKDKEENLTKRQALALSLSKKDNGRKRGRPPLKRDSSSDHGSSSEGNQDHTRNVKDNSESENESSEEIEDDPYDTDYNPTKKRVRGSTRVKYQSEDDSEGSGVLNDDTPCGKCGLFNHPELILLCDSCDAGYHTACLRPPLFFIPDGNWYCPACEHKTLCDKLNEKLHLLDQNLKKMSTLQCRKKRLEYVGISLSNILPESEDDVNEEKNNAKQESSNESSEEDSLTEELSYKTKKKRHKSQTSDVSESEDNRFVKKLTGPRSKRKRQQVNYKFNDYDELLDDAIEEGTEWVWEDEDGNPIERQRDLGNYRRDNCQDDAVQSGKGRGKDIENFLEEYERKKEKEKEEQERESRKGYKKIEDDFEKDEKESSEEEVKGRPRSNRPSLKICKKRRGLTRLSDSENEDDDDESFEESSDDSEESEPVDESDSNTPISESDSDLDFNLRKKKKSKGRPNRSRKRNKWDDFVVGDEYDSEEEAKTSEESDDSDLDTRKRRVARRVNYNEDDSNSNFSSDSANWKKLKKKIGSKKYKTTKKLKPIKHSSGESETDWSQDSENEKQKCKAPVKSRKTARIVSDEDENINKEPSKESSEDSEFDPATAKRKAKAKVIKKPKKKPSKKAANSLSKKPKQDGERKSNKEPVQPSRVSQRIRKPVNLAEFYDSDDSDSNSAQAPSKSKGSNLQTDPSDKNKQTTQSPEKSSKLTEFSHSPTENNVPVATRSFLGTENSSKPTSWSRHGVECDNFEKTQAKQTVSNEKTSVKLNDLKMGTEKSFSSLEPIQYHPPSQVYPTPDVQRVSHQHGDAYPASFHRPPFPEPTSRNRTFMIANLLKTDSQSQSKHEAANTPIITPKPATKANSVAAAVAASSNDDDELYNVTDIVSFITGSNL